MLLAGVVLIWLAKVRPDVSKGRSEIVTDFLRAELLQDGQTATQVFTYDKDILTIGLEFYLPGDQPCGAAGRCALRRRHRRGVVPLRRHDGLHRARPVHDLGWTPP